MTTTHGDEAITELYRAHHRAVRSHALRLVALADADDIVAETFAVAARRLGDIPPLRERAWLLGVAGNVARTQRRRDDRAARLAVQFGLLSPPATTDLTCGQISVEDVAHVHAALQRLRPDDRELLVLAIWHELPVSDIATMLGVTSNTAGVRLHRARRRLAAAIADTGTLADQYLNTKPDEK